MRSVYVTAVACAVQRRAADTGRFPWNSCGRLACRITASWCFRNLKPNVLDANMSLTRSEIKRLLEQEKCLMLGYIEL
jgi:hypothetical protein